MAIYLDHAATSPLRPEVLERMLPYLREHGGNPSSLHASGRRARQGVDEARELIAQKINAQPREIVFTGSGTEADNLAIKGIAWAGTPRGRHIVTTAVEHKAVLNTRRHPGAQQLRGHHAPGGPIRPRRPSRRRRCAHRAHDAGQRDGGEQRGRHDPADRRDRGDRARACGEAPRRCRAVRRP